MPLKQRTSLYDHSSGILYALPGLRYILPDLKLFFYIDGFWH